MADTLDLKCMHKKWQTIMTDSYIDHFTHPPREHPTERAARAYMADLFRRRRCDVQLISNEGAVVEHLRYEPEVPGAVAA